MLGFGARLLRGEEGVLRDALDIATRGHTYDNIYNSAFWDSDGRKGVRYVTPLPPYDLCWSSAHDQERVVGPAQQAARHGSARDAVPREDRVDDLGRHQAEAHSGKGRAVGRVQNFKTFLQCEIRNETGEIRKPMVRIDRKRQKALPLES
jgi:hypothetical protein